MSAEIANPLSVYLRAASQGQRLAPPSVVRETQRRYGFGGKLPRATVAVLLAPFAARNRASVSAPADSAESLRMHALAEPQVPAPAVELPATDPGPSLN